MPVRTELEWAKEICKRQGYYVIQQSRVQELRAQAAITDYEWDTLKHEPKFRRYQWEGLLHQIAKELASTDECILRDERDVEPDPMHYRSPDVRQKPEPSFTTDHSRFCGHIFQTRITVIKYG